MKTPFIGLAKAQEISAVIPTPFHLYDEAAIVANLQALKSAFAWNEGYKEYFAVKATPNPYVLRLLAQQGSGFDCASKVELMLVNKLGYSGTDIMFSSNDTPPEEFVLAREIGATINLDDYSHIDVLSECAGIPETISLRYNPGGEFKIKNTAIMGNPSDAKYGFTKPQLFEGIKRLRAMGAKRIGLHSFLASNTIGNEYYPALAKILFELAVEIKLQLGVEIAFINLSGGIGIPYRPEQQANDISVIGNNVRLAYDKVLRPAGLDKVAIYTELGRFITGPYGLLVTKALNIKTIYKNYVGLDACACNLMRPMMYGAYHHITVLGKENREADTVYDVTGSLCENSDKFAVDRLLPKIDKGDFVVIHDTGAHGYSMGYQYNGKLRSAEVILKGDGSFVLIRRAETPADYFATFDIYPEFKND